MSEGMLIGPGFDSRETIRRLAKMTKQAACDQALVTRSCLDSWEHKGNHGTQLSGAFPGGVTGLRRREEALVRLADLYAGLLWIAGNCNWPRRLDDAPLRAAVDRMRAGSLPYYSEPQR